MIGRQEKLLCLIRLTNVRHATFLTERSFIASRKFDTISILDFFLRLLIIYDNVANHAANAIMLLISRISGFIDLDTGLVKDGVEDATLVAKSFSNVFGIGGEWFIAIAILLFAFTTVLGWSHYGSKAVEYLMGTKASKVYKVIFVLVIVAGAVMESSLAWDISDTFNGLMMIPNLIGVVALFPLVKKITDNYVARKIKNKSGVKPLLSYDEKIQKEHEELVEKGAE